MPIATTDPIADMLTRLRNAVAVRKSSVNLPHSNVKQAVAELLKQNNFVDDLQVNEQGNIKTLEVVINRIGQNARITDIERISRPGRRLYVKADAIPVVKRGRGLVIISTSQGLMTGDEAKRQHLGGELICRVY